MARPRRPSLIARLKRLWLNNRKHRLAGFTLLELLVSMIIGAIIVVALLSLVVEITDSNQKDAARTQTQQEIQAALDFIADDLREAVYVYDGVCLSTGSGNVTANNGRDFAKSCPRLLDYLPANLTGDLPDGTGRRIPVLAFWRTDPLPERWLNACSAAAGNPTTLAQLSNGGVAIPCISGRSYTLVVYTLVDNYENRPSSIWKGRARLERYRLSQFDSNGDTNQGYVPPIQTPNAKFLQWPFQQNESGVISNPQAARPTGTPDVLVDYVDDSTATPVCPNPDPIAITDPTLVSQINSLTPANNASFNPTNIRSFYACVRGETIGVQNIQEAPSGGQLTDAQKTRNQVLLSEQGVNQEVLLVLQGSVAGRPGFPRRSTAAEDAGISVPTTRLSPIQTRVLVRGIVNKNPTGG